MEPVVYQSVCNILSFEMRAKRLHLRPRISLDWIKLDVLGLGLKAQVLDLGLGIEGQVLGLASDYVSLNSTLT